MRSFNRILMSALLCGAAFGITAPASADNFSYSIYLSPTEPLAAYGYIPWAKAITERTGGEVKIETYLGGSLLPARDNLTGTRDGVADIAMHPITYTPSELPIWNIIPDVAFKFPDPFVTAFASTEYGLLDEEGNGEFAAAGVVYLGGYSTPAYHFICRDSKIASVEDLKGKRVRTPGGPWSRFVKSIGMVDVNIPSTEMYTAFERGAVDCGAADPTHLISGSNLLRVAKGYSLMNMGPFFAGASWLINPDSWSRISPENRKIIFEESAKSLVSAMIGYVKMGDEAVAKGREIGIAMVEPAADLTTAYKTFVDGLDADMIAAGNAKGIKNIDKEVADITALMAKWEKLLDGVDRNDQDTMAKLVWDEIYSKLDPNTYGVE